MYKYCEICGGYYLGMQVTCSCQEHEDEKTNMSNLDDGDLNRFIVIKKDYLVSDQSKLKADMLCEYARCQRTVQTGKTNIPNYLVINTDESYADEVIAILKRNGHWG